MWAHRILSKDVQFKDLGLLVVDEEQRFGVAHKEKIKQLKTNVDVLTLTATPIPRTLHMSLIGIRDMSVLEEPPMDRVPIQRMDRCGKTSWRISCTGLSMETLMYWYQRQS